MRKCLNICGSLSNRPCLTKLLKIALTINVYVNAHMWWSFRPHLVRIVIRSQWQLSTCKCNSAWTYSKHLPTTTETQVGFLVPQTRSCIPTDITLSLCETEHTTRYLDPSARMAVLSPGRDTHRWNEAGGNITCHNGGTCLSAAPLGRRRGPSSWTDCKSLEIWSFQTWRKSPPTLSFLLLL